MTITKLAWRDLVPDTDSYQEIFAQPHVTDDTDTLLSDTQPRLQFALEQLLQHWATSSFMLVKAPEELEYLNLIATAARTLHADADKLTGGITMYPATLFVTAQQRKQTTTLRR